MKELVLEIFILTILGFTAVRASSIDEQSLEEVAASTNEEDANLTIRQLIKKYGYEGETHRVTTDDGYILELHRITGPIGNAEAHEKQPILMVHAFLSSSVDWVITGPQKALAYALADAGYDVWIANLRGNKFSRKHVKYSYLDKKYWQFSWHENGIYDLPSTIDYILERTSKRKLVYLGYSMGTTAFWVMATQRPEYQDKIKVMFALAPVAYSNDVKSPVYRVLGKFSNNIEKIMSLLGHYEFKPTGPLLKKIAALGCDDSSWTQPLCKNIIFLIAGFGSDQLNTTMLPVLLAHVPAGGSVKQFVHFLQVVRDRKFQQYDHGFFGNLMEYKRIHPPVYDLSKIKVPVSLHYATDDWLVDTRDVHRLYKELGNPIGKFRVPHDSFGHLDFAWAKDGRRLLYNKLIYLLKKYGDEQLVKKYGYIGEVHHVTNDNGYILEMHRITGPRSSPKSEGKEPVLVVHGLLSSSVDWVITGPERALGYLLADERYDVWLANTRGNTFSRKHKRPSISKKEFWQFSWHEIGCSDLPAMIDYILMETNKKELMYLGHSQGTTGFWVMASERPHYQRKVKGMFALAPVAYLTHMTSPFHRVLAKFGNSIGKIMSMFGYYEFQPTNQFLRELMAFLCDEDAWTQPVCLNVIFHIAGAGTDQLNKTMIPAILGHVPAGASVKQMVHFAQVIKAKKFQQYDHGYLKNLFIYRRFTPPTYDLSKIKVPVSLHYSTNDMFVNPKDVDRLHKELGNPIGKFRVPHEKFSHLDSIWAENGRQLLYNDIIEIMSKYRD